MAPGASNPDAFIDHWSNAEASERANAQLFLAELTDLLGVPRPGNTHADGYSFEFPVRIPTGPDTHTDGRIDLYRRGSFVLEAKQFATEPADPTALRRALDPGAGKKKAGPVRGSEAWDDAMWQARGQAERYARHLPAAEPPAPFLLVVDVGHSLEIFADFTQAGRAYQAFPDPRSFRIRLADLRDDKVRERLRRIWIDPLSLDPAKVSAEVTREIAGYLALLAGSLEDAGHTPTLVAEFLTRCLFCMFAEDVSLLPKDSFRGLLESLRDAPEGFVPKLRTLFAELQTGTDFSVILNRKLLRFNGGLFEDASVLPLDGDQVGILIKASTMQWKDVEPAIFGTLLERALDPEERHQLGAHYTPRAYVERLVLPTVIEPLRAEWQAVRAAALVHAQKGDLKSARAEIARFHRQLCEVTVLDPACGSGNFLYVTLEHLKRLEGEVLDTAAGFGENLLLDLATHSVDPHQFLGIELNPRAASLAEMVLWIGYLQWHFRTRGQTLPAEPVLKKFRNIECRDAVLAWDGDPVPVTWEMALANPDLPGLPDEVRQKLRRRLGDEADGYPSRADATARTDPPPPHVGGYEGPITVWDRRSQKTDLVTGRDVPDETKRVPLLTYPNARPAAWPKADYIVGNPPFIGTSRMRADLGDGYAETLRATYPELPESADFVMYWWHKAAALVRAGAVRRFGLITTNSLRQTFNRRVVQFHLHAQNCALIREVLECGSPLPLLRSRPKRQRTAALQDAGAKKSPQLLSLVFAIPDHPWVDTAEGADVRIAMTVATAGAHPGELRASIAEEPHNDGSSVVTFSAQIGRIAADLTTGANVGGTVPLRASEGLANRGFCLFGSGFIVSRETAKSLGLGGVLGLENHVREYRNGRDLTDSPRGVMCIDLFGLDAEEVRQRFPATYQHVLTHVKPERDSNKRESRRKYWWIFGEPNKEMRRMLVGLPRYIATVETAKHRVFQFLDANVLPDNKLVIIAVDEAFYLGVLSSRIHVVYALAAGSWLGVGNDPVYAKTRCFDPFPFPASDEAAKARIRALGEELDAHRKRVQAQHPGLSLTAMYNVLEKLRAAEPGRDALPRVRDLPSVPAAPTRDGAAEHRGPALLTEKERLVHDAGLVSVLRQLHDELDAAVAIAYGWVQAARAGENPVAEDLSDAEILIRLVALNAARAAEEAAGKIRWLRPAYQTGSGGSGAGDPSSVIRGRKVQATLDLPATDGRKAPTQKPKVPGARSKIPWPKPLAERVRAVETALRSAGGPVTAAALAKRFTRAKPEDLAEILETLATLGRAQRGADGASYSL